MRVGVISDLHANLPALEAVLADMDRVDAMVCAGDVIGYYTWPGACVEAMMERSVPTVMGNHDRELVTETPFRFSGGARAGVTYAEDHLEERHRAWLGDLPDDRVAFDGRMRVVHGHPHDPNRYTYPQDVGPDILEDEPILVLGHTHVQFHREVGDGLVLNPGSVGQPRDGDPRAAYAIVDVDERTAETFRVGYDIDRVQAAVREADLPVSLADRLEEGR